MVKQKPGYYGILPANVRYDDKLVPMARILYTEVTALTGSTGECTASNNYFAKLYGVSIATVSSWVSQLVDGGYVLSVVDRAAGNKRKLRIPIQKNLNSSTKKDEDPYSKKPEDNNTSSNSIPKDIKIIYVLYLKEFVVPRLKNKSEDMNDNLREAMKVYKLTDKRRAKIEARLKEVTPGDIVAAIRGYGSEDWTHIGAGNRPNWEADLTEYICHKVENIEKGVMIYNSMKTGVESGDAWDKLS